LVYTLQTDNNLTHLNEIILKNAFLLVELILQVWGGRDTTEYSIGTTIRIYTVNISKIFRIEIGAHVLQLV